MLPAIRLSLTLLILFLFSCASPSVQVEEEFQQAVSYLKPLRDYRSVTCELSTHLPASFKARKLSELKGEERQEWESIIQNLNRQRLRWTTSNSSCWVKGFERLIKEAPEGRGKEFLNNLDAQVRVANCVLLPAFLYSSPFAGLRRDRYHLKGEEEGFTLTPVQTKGAYIRWAPEKGKVESKTSKGEVLSASYENKGKKLKLVRAGIQAVDKSVVIDHLQYKTLPSGRLLLSEYLLSLQMEEQASVPQLLVKFHSCVARISDGSKDVSPESEGESQRRFE